MGISLIFAMDHNRGIGLNNRLPWHLPEDLRFFKNITLGHTVLMGRKTYESIGKSLPGRTNLILTQNESYRATGCEIVHSGTEVAARYRDEELFVIGGAEVFRLLMPEAARLYITRIECEFAVDTYFDRLPEGEWKLVSSEQGVKDGRNPYDYYFEKYERIQQ